MGKSRCFYTSGLRPSVEPTPPLTPQQHALKVKAERGGERNRVRLVFSRQSQVQENLYPSAPRSLLPPPSPPLPPRRRYVLRGTAASTYSSTPPSSPPCPCHPLSPPLYSPDLPRAIAQFCFPEATQPKDTGTVPFTLLRPRLSHRPDYDADGAAAPCAGAAGGGDAGGHGVRGLHGQPVLCRPH